MPRGVRPIQKTLDKLYVKMGDQENRLFVGVRGEQCAGGYERALSLNVLHEYRMTAEDVAATAGFIAENDLEELRQRCGLSAQRMALFPLRSKF